MEQANPNNETATMKVFNPALKLGLVEQATGLCRPAIGRTECEQGAPCKKPRRKSWPAQIPSGESSLGAGRWPVPLETSLNATWVSRFNFRTLIFLIVCTQIGRAADPLDIWIWRYPSPPRLTLRAVTYGKGQYVAVGDRGVILTSTDRVNWVQRFFPIEDTLPDTTPGELQAVIYANNQFVAVGTSYRSNIIITSADGANWVKRFSSIRPNWEHLLTGIAYGNGQYVAVGENSAIVTSTDGVNWVQRASGMTDTIDRIGYGDGKFVAVSWTNSGSKFASSADALNWVSGNSLPGWVRSIAYGNGQFVAVGDDSQNRSAQIFTSADGVNWVKRESGTPGLLADVLYDGSQFLAVGCAPHGSCAGTVVTSADGVSWVQSNSGVPESVGGLTGIGYGNGQYVALGGYGLIVTSDDGVNWFNPLQDEPLEMSGSLSSVGYGNGRFVAVGSLSDYSTFFVTSVDGVSWDQTKMDTLKGSTYGIAYGNGLFVAVAGAFGTSSGLDTEGAIATSADGMNWVKRFSEENAGALSSAVAYGNGQFVVPKSGGTVTSSDGIHWTAHKSATVGYVSRIAYGNGQFVAADSSNGSSAILTSADGTNWVQHLSPGKIGYSTRIAYGNGRFVAVNLSESGIATSTDGIDWVVHQGISGNDITYGAGQFVVVAGLLDGPRTIHTSADGINWVTRIPGISWGTGTFNGITYGNGHFVICGSGRMILQSGRIINLSITLSPATGTLTVSLEGPIGLDYSIQTSSDLISWRDVTKISNTQSSKVILEGLPIFSDRQFYRATSLNPGSAQFQHRSSSLSPSQYLLCRQTSSKGR